MHKKINCLALVISILTAALCSISANAAMQCLDQHGTPVPWWIIIKLPQNIDPTPQPKGYGYFYIDANQSTAEFHPDNDPQALDQPNQSLYYTIKQVYTAAKTNPNNTAWLMYNDSAADHPPFNPFCVGKDPSDQYSEQCGHTKGIISFDAASGFWLVHSITSYPLPTNQGDNYRYSSSPLFGQSALCVSLPVTHDGQNQFNNIGQQLKYGNPLIYDYNIPNQFQAELPNLVDVITQHDIKTTAGNNTAVLYDVTGKRFASFMQTNPFPYFNPVPFYQYVATNLQQSILVQSWLNEATPEGALCDSKNKINVITNLKTNNGYSWPTEQDHSKWAISVGASNTVCISDLNHTQGSTARGGGSVCFNANNAHQFLAQMIANTQSCSVATKDETSDFFPIAVAAGAAMFGVFSHTLFLH